MLKISGLDKYFFKGKKNQIHVINNTSVELPDTGLVALLGPSGCGKTTLLNVIGGLDKANKGDVYIGNQRITRRRSGKVDAIRSLQIGYIFQNYNLVEDMTVFENVAMALRMIGVKDEKVIEEKVNYVLRKTGIYRYGSRLAEMLSGGERQRVGIARAIVKDPAVIIADEPTGNLDSKNTIDVMNIIKTISKDKLVILVTHEEELAGFYADRIIRIRDGSLVSDEENKGTDGLDYKMDYKVYLGDIQDHKRLRSDRYDIDFYNESGRGIGLDIVIRNGSILIRSKDPGARLEVVDEDSPVEFIEGGYHKLAEGDETETDFDPEKLKIPGKRRYRSLMGPLKMIKTGFSRVGDYGAIKKILLAGFVISALFVTYSVCQIFGLMNVTDDMFVTADKSYITVVSKNTDPERYKTIKDAPNVDYVLPGDSRIALRIKTDEYMQTSAAVIAIEGSLSDAEKLQEEDLIYGALPQSADEIVVDRMAVRSAIDEQLTQEVGLSKVKDYVGRKVDVGTLGEMTITGISNLTSPCIYADRTRFVDMIACSDLENDYSEGLINYDLVKDDIKLAGGDWPKGDYEVMVTENYKDDIKIGKTIDTKVADHRLKVSGYFKDSRDSEYLLVSKDTLRYKLMESMKDLTVNPVDKDVCMAELKAMDLNVRDTYSQARKDYIKQNRDYTRSSILAAIMILAISCIEIYIIMRASFLSRIRQIGVYRAIGMKKGDIYRMFTGEILAITTMTSLPGFAFMFYLLYRLGKVSYFETSFLTTPLTAAISLGIIYFMNLLFGLLPVYRTVRKRPAEILSRTDIN